MTTLFHESRTVRGSGAEGLTVVSVYRCMPYSDYVPALAQMLGGVALVGGKLVRTLPLRDSVHPWLFCQEVEVEGVGAQAGVLEGTPAAVLAGTAYYEKGARLTVTFKPWQQGGEGTDSATASQAAGEPPTPEVNEENLSLANEQCEFSAQQLTLPDKWYKWETGAADDLIVNNQQVNVAKTYPRIDYTLTRNMVLSLPKQTIAKLLGKVNRDAFMGWPPECVRFDGLGVARKVTTNDLPYMDLTYKWAIQPTWEKYWNADAIPPAAEWGHVGWNRLYNPKKGYWERVVLTTDPTRRIYELDSELSQVIDSRTIVGFHLLFHPKAT